MTLLVWVALVTGFIAGACAGVAFTVAVCVGLWRWAARVVRDHDGATPQPVESRDPLWVVHSRGYN